MTNFLDIIIKLIIIFTFAYGLWLLLGNYILNFLQNIVRKNSKLMGVKNASWLSSSKFIKDLTNAMAVVFKRNIVHEVYTFLAGSLFILVFCFFSFLRIKGIVESLVLSALISSIPYLALQAKLKNIRIESSYEGIELVTKIINNYKQNNYNIIEAIDNTACSDTLSFYTRNNLLWLSMVLKAYKDEKELDDAISNFVFAYNTEWSVLLGMNIRISAFDGINVSVSMEDILVELKNVGEILEINKRYNNESFTMIRYMLIPLYLFTVYVSVTAFGFTFNKFIQYQFFTELGLSFAILVFFSIALCFLVYSFVKRPKFDI